MELITAKMAQALKAKTELWTVKLTELGSDHAFMGYSLTSTYLMVDITSPILENQVSINSIPEKDHEMIVPIVLENCETFVSGHISFRGLDKIIKKWELYFIDRRFDTSVKVESSNPIAIKKLERNTRSEHLKLIGYTKNNESRSCFFELQLKSKMNLK
ncbi:MAG: hypothetical protein BalsKO_01120 [Balneolaceae bacterium]